AAEVVVGCQVAKRLQRPREGHSAVLGPERQTPDILVLPTRETPKSSGRNRISLAGKNQLADLLQRQIPRRRQVNEQLSVPWRQNDRHTLALLRSQTLLFDLAN